MIYSSALHTVFDYINPFMKKEIYIIKKDDDEYI